MEYFLELVVLGEIERERECTDSSKCKHKEMVNVWRRSNGSHGSKN
jgi:hypothetical protein